MNLILFTASEASAPLPRSDPRAKHIIDVLRRRPGDSFDAGLIDGPRGRGTVVACDRGNLTLAFAWDPEAAAVPDPVVLLIGLPRPQTARKILREAGALGVEAMHFFMTEKGDAAYAGSELWTTDEWRRHLVAGAEQAFDTRLPRVSWGRALVDVLTELPAESGHRIALDVYESPAALGDLSLDAPGGSSVALAIGPERGWSPTERELLRDHRFAFAHLGRRVLRTETAVVAGLAVLKSRLGWWR